MIDTTLIIVFGVSGVGKTTACVEYANRYDDVVHFSASALLKLDRVTSGTRSANEMMEDQERLVGLVREARLKTRASLMLLDAHSLVFVSGREIVIPPDVIAAMQPTGLIFFMADGALVSERRTSRGDAWNVTPEEIDKSQKNALAAAELYAKQLPCQLLVVEASQGADLAGAIRRLS